MTKVPLINIKILNLNYISFADLYIYNKSSKSILNCDDVGSCLIFFNKKGVDFIESFNFNESLSGLKARNQQAPSLLSAAAIPTENTTTTNTIHHMHQTEYSFLLLINSYTISY